MAEPEGSTGAGALALVLSSLGDTAGVSGAGHGFIREVGLKLGLPQLVIGAAMVLYHRFNASPSAGLLDESLVCVALVYLAAKSHENPRDLRDVITTGFRALHPGTPVLRIDEFYRDLRESVINCELLALRALGFDTSVTHPHPMLLHFAELLEEYLERNTRNLSASKSHTKTVKYFVGRAVGLGWCMLNDSYHSLLVVDTAPDVLAVGAMCFAARVLDVYDLLQLDVAAPAFCPTLTLEVQLTVAQRLSRVYSGTAGPAQAPHLPTTPEMTAASITGIK